MNKDGHVAKFKHHDMAETKDDHKHSSNNHGMHKKGGHTESHGGKVKHISEDGNGFQHHPVKGEHHHKGNLGSHGQHEDKSGGYLAEDHEHGSGPSEGTSPREDLNTGGR